MPKKFTDKQLLGDQGIALIHQAVSKIGFVWRPLDRNDVGVDGEIEIRDTTTGDMTGLIIKVQSKAVSSFANETAEGFDFWPAECDIQYWLSLNVPVILIVSRPATHELYWRHVRQQVADSPDVKRFHFVKARDRLDASARIRLMEIVQTEQTGTFPFIPDNTETPDPIDGGCVIPGQTGAPPDNGKKSEIRHRESIWHSNEVWGRKIFLAFVTIFGGYAAAMLPLMVKSGLTNQEIIFETTRITMLLNGGAIPNENIYTLSLILAVPNAMALWFIGRFLAKPVIGGVIRYSWCEVDESLSSRIIGLCILASGFVLAGHYCWLLFPSMSYWNALYIPLLAFAAMCAHAKNG